MSSLVRLKETYPRLYGLTCLGRRGRTLSKEGGAHLDTASNVCLNATPRNGP